MKNKRLSLVSIFLLTAAFLASAQTTTTTAPASSDPAKEIMDRVNEVVCTVLTVFVYISAGLAALMIMFAGVKYMTSGDDAESRSGAKNMIVYSLCGLVAVLLACPIVDYLVTGTGITPFSKSCNCVSGGLSGNSTGNSTGTTTTTLGTSNMLTATALVACINSAGGKREEPYSGCPACTYQGQVFTDETNAPWGPGDVEYNKITTVDMSTTDCPDGLGSTIMPCWTRPGHTPQGGCNTFQELNTFYGCGLSPDTGHSYQICH